MNSERLTLEPAYGRKYDCRESVIKDWHAMKDFRIVHANGHTFTGPYFNKKDCQVDSIVTIRWSARKELKFVQRMESIDWIA